MAARFSLLIFISAIFVPVHAEQTYESERLTLHQEAFLSGSLSDERLIENLFDSDFLEIDLFGGACDREEFKCDTEPMFRIKGISKAGQETLKWAAKAYEAYQLDLRDEEDRLFVAFCETGINDPGAIAREKADIRNAIFKLKMQFYEQVVSDLDESDVLHLERHNSEHYGTAHPAMNDTRQQMQRILAKRFPQEYRQEHLKHCVTASENKGLPFRLFRRVLYGCEQTTHSYGQNGEKLVSESASNVDECMMIEYLAQKPEKPGDVELTYE